MKICVPEWVKTEEDLDKFADEYTNNNISVGYELLDDDQMEVGAFIEQILSDYEGAKQRNFDSIVIAIDTDLNTYYISDTPEGFQCDLWDYCFDNLKEISERLFYEMHGNVTDIRIE